MTSLPFARQVALLSGSILALASVNASAQNAGGPGHPLKVLLITGGCCHDYAKQKDILKEGLEARINVVVEQVHTDDKTTKPPLAIWGNPDYAKGYDLVIHDECGDALNEPEKVLGVLNPHKNGIPGVNLHCAMHCYRIGNPNDPVTLGTPHGY